MAAATRARSNGVFPNPVRWRRTPSARNVVARIARQRDGGPADESDPCRVDEPNEETLRPRVSVECHNERENRRKRHGAEHRGSTSALPGPRPLRRCMRHPPGSETQQRSRRGEHEELVGPSPHGSVDRSQTLASAADTIKPRTVTRCLLLRRPCCSCVSMCNVARRRVSLQSGRLVGLVGERWTTM